MVTESLDEALYVGVDGCRAGWFYVALNKRSEWSAGVVTSLKVLLAVLPGADLILIDMPIGLRESGSEGRVCDREARKVLGRARAASIFPVPVRAALDGETYQEATVINRRLTGKGLSLQTWNIMPKLRELDVLMRHSANARRLFRESHPEVCFWSFNERRMMEYNKKTPEGRLEREAVIYRYFPAMSDLLAYAGSRYRRAQLGWDDMLDSLVLAITAQRNFSSLRTLPEQPECDAFGLPMEIVWG